MWPEGISAVSGKVKSDEDGKGKERSITYSFQLGTVITVSQGLSDQLSSAPDQIYQVFGEARGGGGPAQTLRLLFWDSLRARSH